MVQTPEDKSWDRHTQKHLPLRDDDKLLVLIN